MISSAKITAFSFLALTALGATVWVGCTTTSGTTDDTNGGNQNTDTDGGSTDTDGGSTDTDGGAATCTSKQKGTFDDVGQKGCQACVEKSCCTNLTTCFDIAGDVDGGTLDCNGYHECIIDCNGKPEAERDACFKDCDDTAASGVQTAYEGIESCATTNCASECGTESPDGG